MIRLFFRNKSGATSIEYSLIIALIFLVCLITFYTFGDKVSSLYQHIDGEIAKVS